jgi:hypothetical protein
MSFNLALMLATDHIPRRCQSKRDETALSSPFGIILRRSSFVGIPLGAALCGAGVHPQINIPADQRVKSAFSSPRVRPGEPDSVPIISTRWAGFPSPFPRSRVPRRSSSAPLLSTHVALHSGQLLAAARAAASGRVDFRWLSWSRSISCLATS